MRIGHALGMQKKKKMVWRYASSYFNVFVITVGCTREREMWMREEP